MNACTNKGGRESERDGKYLQGNEYSDQLSLTQPSWTPLPAALIFKIVLQNYNRAGDHANYACSFKPS